ncbi:unnamed protein product, partial [Tenebrio molitor]
KIESRPDDYPQFRVRENVIYKYASAAIPLETNVREWKIYIPVNRRKEVLRASHDPPTASHFGYFKTLARVTANYYWPNIRKDVAKYVKAQAIWFTARYHPQVNFVERSNRTVGTAIRSYVDTHDNWDAEIPKIQHAINTARHEITGFSPTFLNFARHVPLSGNYYGNV